MSTAKKTVLKQKLAQARTDLQNLLAPNRGPMATPFISEGATWTVLASYPLVENEEAWHSHPQNRQGKERCLKALMKSMERRPEGRMGSPPQRVLENMPKLAPER